jgi:hypothetical protein
LRQDRLSTEVGSGVVRTLAGESFFGQKIFLVLVRVFVKATVTMKRTYTLIVLLGLVVCGLLTGCNDSSKPDAGAMAPSTNAPAAANTNK